VQGGGCWPAQAFAVLPGVGQSSPSSLTQDLPFECGEDGRLAGHRPAGWRSQVQRLAKKTLRDSAFLDACLAAISAYRSCMGEDYPFRPGSLGLDCGHILERDGRCFLDAPALPKNGLRFELPHRTLD
jgi:hypothetical protein